MVKQDSINLGGSGAGLRFYRLRVPIGVLIEKSISSIINPLGELYHGVHILLKGQRIAAIIISADVLLIGHTVVVRHVEIGQDVYSSDPLVIRVKFLTQFISGTDGLGL